MSLKCLLVLVLIHVQILVPSKAATVKMDTKTSTQSTVTVLSTRTSNGSLTSTVGAISTDTSGAPVTTNPTTSTTPVPTTQPPVSHKLGDNCTSVVECNSTISGDVLCDGICKCNETNNHLYFNETTCLNGSKLVPSVVITGNTTDSINVSWSHIIDTGNLSLTYNITAVSARGTVICTLDISALPAYCNPLVPGTMYTVNVEVNVAGTSVVEIGSANQTTVPGKPGSIDKTQSSLKGHNISLTWNNSAGNVDYYNVTLGSRTVSTLNNSAEFFNLRDGKTYTVTIIAISNGLVSEARLDNFTTTVKEPDPPSNPTIVMVNASSVKIGWSPPIDPRGEMVGYEIRQQRKVYKDEDYTQYMCTNTTAPNMTYTGLSAGTFYRFEIFSINEEFLSLMNASIDQRTNETEPEEVSNLTITPGNNTLIVTWNRPSTPNGDIISYVLRWIESESQSTNKCAVYFRTNQSLPSHVTTTDQMTCPNETVNITVNEKNMTYEIQDLKAFKYYNISVTAYTIIGKGQETTGRQQTSLMVPEKVTDVTVDDINATAVNISWTIPAMDPGLVNYTVVIWDVIWENLSDVTPCSVTAEFSLESYNSASCIQTGLHAFWQYKFSVQASNGAGSSISNMTDLITTQESYPGAVENITTALYTNDMNCDATRVKVAWRGPKLLDRNANITRYEIIDQSGTSMLMSTASHPIMPWGKNQSMEGVNVSEKVTAETSFQWKIRAISSTNLGGANSSFNFTTKSCKPPVWGDREDIKTATMVTTNSLKVKVDRSFFNDQSQGRIKERGFVVSHQKAYVNGNLEQIGDWRNSSQLYRVILDQLQSVSRSQYEITIGSKDCNTATKPYCNAFLPQDTSIYLVGYVCTKGYKCSFTPTFGPFRTAKKEDKPAVSAGIVASVTILVALVIAVAILAALWYRGVIDPPGWFIKKPVEDEQPLSTLFPAASKTRPIVISRYSEALDELHRDTNLLLSDQYEDIGKLSREITERSTFNAANIEANKPKNRWVNILPYDHSRVKLQQLDDDDPTSDYVNANYMPGFHNQREYIASQGPLPSTVDDFWRMVWEQNVKIIVMLTQCKEGNRVKCEMYWPNQLREPKQYGEVIVNPISISALDKYNISIFNVSMQGQERQVTHLHYLDFPDFSANVEYDHFLDFVTTARSLVPHDNEGPIIVHCSAGVGRTGTFIAMDRLQMSLLSPYFSYEDTVDIFNIVMSLRENRVFMVQTESQYILIHDCYLKMLETKKLREMKTDSDDNLYANDGFGLEKAGKNPYPEVLYENVNCQDLKMKTEL